ncbi:MAG: DUF1134 domain-containing protein [Hyphomonadaceae bacterium]|nr:DUF1134 domain-containing protein [Hyphomonadaceae bacterium]
MDDRKKDDHASRRAVTLGLGATGLLTLPGLAYAQEDGAYSEPEVIGAANRFFGAGAEGLADVVRHVFAQFGRPNGYIQGQEASGAIGVGLRYGEGHLFFRHRSASTRVFWQGPSIGFDVGGDGAKCFTLVYGMRRTDQIFQRFPGVEGSAYYVGGVGVNYQRADNITLAPIRFGVGFRLGANVGYLAYSRRRRIVPF